MAGAVFFAGAFFAGAFLAAAFLAGAADVVGAFFAGAAAAGLAGGGVGGRGCVYDGVGVLPARRRAAANAAAPAPVTSPKMATFLTLPRFFFGLTPSGRRSATPSR